MTATLTEFTATDAGLPVASQEPSPAAGSSAVDRLLARGRIRGALAMLGPAFVASVAYVDPGNFATNIQGGAQYGYLLLWVVLAANLIGRKHHQPRRVSRAGLTVPDRNWARTSASAREEPRRVTGSSGQLAPELR